MVRNETEINIKWMLTLSLLFHLLFLLTLSYSNLFSRLFSPTRIGMPLSAIHVNLVDIPRERIPEAPAAEKPAIDRKLEVKSEKPEVQSKKQEVKSKKQEMKNPKVVQKAKMALPEPAVKEKSPPSSPIKEEGRKEEMDTQRQQTPPATETRGQEARLSPAGPAVSGPVVDISNFKYDYYLGVIRNKIDSRWSQPVAYSQVKQALIEFTIHRNGEIGNIRVSESSGDHYFDQTALRAVSLSNPFPPLPRGYKEDLLKVRYRFIFGGKG